MPKYRSITIELHCQFDVEILPEFDPLPQEHYTSRGIVRTVPKVVDESSSTCSVYVPVLPGSTFWIGYSVSPPVPDGHYFLFKLYINGTHIVSWSTGKEEGWKGKTMFGLYERPEYEEGKRKVEKRVLCFTPPDKNSKAWEDVKDPFEDRMRMEIKVHRAHGRTRVEREMEEYGKTQYARGAKGINLVNAGRASSEQPKRFYRFALTDPVDQPFATFRYYYRSWDQLRDLGLLEGDWQSAREDNDMPVIEPYEDSAHDGKPSRASYQDVEDVYYECGDGAADTKSHFVRSSADRHERLKSHNKSATGHSLSSVKKRKPWTVESSQRCASDSEQLRAYIPRGAPSAKKEASDEQTCKQPQQGHSSMRTQSQFSSTAYRPHPAYPVEGWRVRTPSPVRSIREGIKTPPLEKPKDQGSRASSLMNAISSTWRRRETPSSDRHNSAGGPSGARSTSR